MAVVPLVLIAVEAVAAPQALATRSLVPMRFWFGRFSQPRRHHRIPGLIQQVLLTGTATPLVMDHPGRDVAAQSRRKQPTDRGDNGKWSFEAITGSPIARSLSQLTGQPP
jgi:hypothetical protein